MTVKKNIQLFQQAFESLRKKKQITLVKYNEAVCRWSEIGLKDTSFTCNIIAKWRLQQNTRSKSVHCIEVYILTLTTGHRLVQK